MIPNFCFVGSYGKIKSYLIFQNVMHCVIIRFNLLHGYSQEQNRIFQCRDKLLPVFKHGFLRSEENVYLAMLYTHKSVSENV